MEAVTLETIHKDIEFVKQKITKIEEHMVDADSILTLEDFKALQEYSKEKSNRALTSHGQLKKELGL